MSPTVFREGNFRVYFFSLEESRMHIHVHGKNGEAKFFSSPALLTHRQVIANHRKKNAVKPCVNWFHGIMTFSKFSSTCPIATI